MTTSCKFDCPELFLAYIKQSSVGVSTALILTSKVATRSIYGCWTCRVRRKKCDENRPTCSTCISLKLDCYGYGTRPVWMDNGPLQRQQALRVKNIVGQNNPKRRKRQKLLPPSSPFFG